MSEEEIKASGHHPADTNGDGKVGPEEHDMYLEFKRKELPCNSLQYGSSSQDSW